MRHRLECEVHNVFPRVWVGNDGPLPWRLTQQQVQMLDTRVRNLVYPHGSVTVGSSRFSFWKRPVYASKLSQRIMGLLFIFADGPARMCTTTL